MMFTMLQSKLSNTYTIVFIFILIVAGVLRCYNLSEIPLTNDELSALSRAQYSSFSQLIEFGVQELDRHPALVQVFIFYYIKWFGISAFAVKLPFIISGLLSIAMAYVLFKKVLNAPTAIVVATYMATAQFFIMHSQTARPYAIGLLLVLTFAWLLTFLQSPKYKMVVVVSAFVFMLIASTHYLALFTSIIIGMVAFIAMPSNRLKLAAIAALAFVLYIPQLPIFYYHIGIGGVGSWLGKPAPNYIFNFVKYLAQYNTLNIILFTFSIGLQVWLMLFMPSKFRKNRKQVLALLSVFVVFYVVSYFYSVYRNPVLQYPAMLFATPFLLAAIAYPISVLSKRMILKLVIVFTGVQLYALVFQRQHYTVFYHQSYKTSVESIVKFANENTPLLLNANDVYYYQYYFELNHFKPNIISARIDSLSHQQFSALVDSIDADTIVIAHGFYLPLIYKTIAQQQFNGCVYESHDAFTDNYILSRIKPQQKVNMLNIEADIEYAVQVMDSFVAEGSKMNIEASVKISVNDTLSNPLLVVAVKDESGNNVYYGQAAFTDFNYGNSTTKTVLLSETFSAQKDRKYSVSTFVWNAKGDVFLTSTPHVEVSKGNSKIFATIDAVVD